MSLRGLQVSTVLLTLAWLAFASASSFAQINDGDLGALERGVAESETGSYVVVMKAEPLVRSYSQQALQSPAAKARGRALAKGHEKVLEDAGAGVSRKVNSFTNALNGFSAILSYEEARRVAAQPDVAFVMPDELRQVETDSSPDFLGLTGEMGVWSTEVTGEGVVVGVIDTGIWPEHPSFADDGSYAAPPTSSLPCEFGNIAHNPDDASFTCNNKLIGAQQFMTTYRVVIGAASDEYDSARDDDGHGTHTASTAAGNANVPAEMYGLPLGMISGVAPRAHVVAYKSCGNLGCFTSDLAAAIDQSVADGVDVINYSIGGSAGAPGADEIAFLFAADAGVFVATSAGNNGPGPATVGNPATMPWVTSVGASTQPRFFEGTIQLGDGETYTGASITPGLGPTALVDAEFAGGELCIPGTLDPGLVAGKIVLCRRGAIGRSAKSLAVFNAGGVATILYNNDDVGNLFTDTHWTPTVHIDNTPGLAIKNYIASTTSPTAVLDTGLIGEWPSAPSMTIFSSRGPNSVAPDIIKPDVTAPGIQILAGYSPTPDPGAVQGELFAAIAGTSMSSPHVAGLFALLKQAHPEWSPAVARSALMTTAYQDVVDNDRVTMADPFDMGAGHVDPGFPNFKGSSFQPGLAYDAGFNEYLGFICDSFPELLSDPASTCAFLDSIGIPVVASNLNYPSLGVAEVPGSATVVRTVTSVAQENGNRQYDVWVDPPDGYDVTVSPSTIHLRSGQTATYEVSITNMTAPLGEWRFGSLAWMDKNGHYAVRSPMAVKADLFGAPEALFGSGESGTVSFDVKFGYSGSYTAAAHGLEPAIVTADTVLQDPDQAFNPVDGFSNEHQFVLNGAAHLRVALPPEATEAGADLDLYVYNPSGIPVASSTGAGTDEIINIPLPADGTWSVWVHGWAAPGGDSDYDLYAWVISATPGGNLSIDSAPSSATIGETGSVVASWSGASAGEWHLGAVSHTGDSGLMGLTFVEVDNR